MSASRVAGTALFVGLAVLGGLRLVWIGQHAGELRPVGGGDLAPPFTLPLQGGGRFTLEPGEPTLIDFWATWCEPCREELPRVDAVYRRVQGRGLRVVAVNVEGREAIPAVERFAREAHLALPLALEGEGIAEQYKVNNLPHLVVVDRAGTIRRVLLGMQDEETLTAALEAAGRP